MVVAHPVYDIEAEMEINSDLYDVDAEIFRKDTCKCSA